MGSDADYDAIAGMYHALWYDWYLPAAMPALERLFFERVSAGATVLDVCCGSGHVTKELVKRGYKVTGVDVSAKLIELARRQLPEAEFVVQDVRSLELPQKFEAALSTFDALNHILSLADLHEAFRKIHNSLSDGALFVFDMNMDEAYAQDIKEWLVDINENSVGMVRGEYDGDRKRARTELMWFSRSETDGDCWRQRHRVVEEQCYSRDEIRAGLTEAGFQLITTAMGADLGMRPALGLGRMFITAVA